MADFTARITSGATSREWDDPATNDAPGRTNTGTDILHRHFVVELGQTVTIKATVNGVEGPLDVTLGGRTFYRKWAELPYSGGLPTITSPPGQTSVFTFTPFRRGHYLFMVRRMDGGGFGIPFDVINPIV